MAKIKYFYNPDTCTYERVKPTLTDISLSIFLFLGLSLVMSIVLTAFYSSYYTGEKEQALKEENQELLEHFNILNKEVTELQTALKSLQQRDDNIYRVIFEAEPIPTSIRTAGSGGTEKYKELLRKGLKKEKLILEARSKIDQMKKSMYVQTKSYDDIAKLIKNKSEMMSCMPAIQPVANKGLTRLTSGFGMRVHPIYKVGQFHPGIDFAAPQGTPIYATADGAVEKAEFEGGYGNHITINHGYGYKTLYGHMYEMRVRKGQKVKRGELIGSVGSTGFSTAPHVHYEVLYNDEHVNPVFYFFKDLTANEYEKVLELASKPTQSLE